MKILLIFPPSTIYGDDPTIPAVVFPLGLSYLAAYLEKNNYEVDLLDARSNSQDRVIVKGTSSLYGLTDAEMAEYIKKSAPDVVGISCMFTAYSGDIHRIAKLVKEWDPRLPVIVGGAHASTFPKLVLKDVNVDAVVHSEGEVTFLDLVQQIESKKDYKQILGISHRVEGQVVKNPSRPFVQDLDEFPFPAHHLTDMSIYLKQEPTLYSMRAPSMTMITSRGCPLDCTFCTIQSVWGSKKWRRRSPENVVDEMEFLRSEYGIQELYLMDDSAGASGRRMMEICDEIIRRKLDIRWTLPNGIAHWSLSEKILDKMKQAGCYRVTYGIEAVNMETRKFLGKPFGLEQGLRMIKHANKIGMWTICTFIMGFPLEPRESIMQTIDFGCNSGTDLALFYLLCPHPGTAVYEVCKKEGLLNFDHILDPTGDSGSIDFEKIGIALSGGGNKTKYFSAQELKDFQGLAYKKFFKARVMRGITKPMSIINKLKSFEDARFTFKIAKEGAKATVRSLTSSFASQKFRKNKFKYKDENPQAPIAKKAFI